MKFSFYLLFVKTSEALHLQGNRCAGSYPVKKVDYVIIFHTNTAMGSGLTHGFGIRCAMNVDVTTHGIDITQAINAGFPATQPENAGKNPIPPGILLRQIGSINLTGKTAPHEYRIQRATGTYSGADIMLSQGCLAGVFLIANAIHGGGYRPAGDTFIATEQTQLLLVNGNQDVLTGVRVA